MNSSTAPLLAAVLTACLAPLHADPAEVAAPKMQPQASRKTLSATSARKFNPTSVGFRLSGNRRMTLDFYGESIFRWFRDDRGGIIRDPEAEPPAKILTARPRSPLKQLDLTETDHVFSIRTSSIRVDVRKKDAALKVVRLSDGETVLETSAAPQLGERRTTLRFTGHGDEYFFGGGVQNGRFSHKGKVIAIENQNSWTDGGVASPNPYYWSTRGYGLMWHTFRKGSYDFGSGNGGEVVLSHDTGYLDVFIMVGKSPSELLGHYFQLTGKPVLLPKTGFYLGHLNAYNRDYWKKSDDGKGVLFEDGKSYKESQKDNGGTRETLNGEKDNYQFSARAAIDRYAKHDMPLGWILPNDGYGAGYGQTDSLEGNVENLRKFGDYARKRGVEIGLWTQSDLHPKPGVSPLLQRDLVREVRDAGVRVLKTDVAWVGAGYSFGLHGIADAAQLMSYYGNDARPFIITLDGWAGTQRYAGVWTGDQTGGQWEYIRFHLPTYIGAGLSGMSNICSDMDGIFGGKNPVVNTRDYQWKTFTSMQLNMDGWGANPKYPQALGEPATSINRWYLKLKSELLPYTYSIARDAVDGLPMVRAMFLDTANPYTLGSATRYQFLYGPSFLVAPVYQETSADESGNDVRNNIYLPEGQWIDFFSGDIHEGGRIINNFPCPLWKLPVFVRRGAIIPMARPHNNPGGRAADHRIYAFYPHGKSSFTEYDDDGRSEQYKRGIAARTEITSELAGDTATLVVGPTRGSFDGFSKDKTTGLRVNLTAKPRQVSASVNGKALALREADSLGALRDRPSGYYYEAKPNLNRFATPGSELAKLAVTKNPVLHVKLPKLDTTRSRIEVSIEGYRYDSPGSLLVSSGQLTAPEAGVGDGRATATTLAPSWEEVANADYYEIEFRGMLYSTIRETSFLFEDLTPETKYAFKVRAVNKDGASAWAEVRAATESDPYEFAIKGILASTKAPAQGNQGIGNLTDLDPSSLWHTKWGEEAVPFEFKLDLRSVNTLDKFQYFPRPDGRNGTLLEGSVFHSMNGTDWTKAGDFSWPEDGETKEFRFKGKPRAGYLKFKVAKAVGKFGSGRQLYVFKVPGTESYIPGDINADNRIDDNDLTSYENYTGLRKGDSDFEGYISKGDINGNGLIDAYDISLVATRLEGGVRLSADDKPLAGTLELRADKAGYNAGDVVEITVSGKDLASVNALSFAMPYDPEELSYQGTEVLAMGSMKELTRDRLHSNGTKALYPTFANLGNQPQLEGSEKLFRIRFTAKRKLRFKPAARDGILVSKGLESKTLWKK